MDAALNLAWLAVDAAAIAALARTRGPVLPLAIAVIGGNAIALGTLLATGDLFAVLRAAAWFLFVHLPLVLLAIGGWVAGRRRWGAWFAAVALIAVGVDAFVVEPRALEVARYTVPARGLAAPLRVVALSDVQTDRVGAYERRAFALAMDMRPDLVLLPGDFVQVSDEAAYRAELPAFRALLAGLHAPLGVWAVQGNIEWRPTWIADLFDGTGVRAAPSTTTIDLGPLWLSAVSFADGFDPALVLPRPAGGPAFHLAFAHAPDLSLSPDVGADLLVAGHTHGGQVQLPLVGPLVVLSQVSRAVGGGGLSALPGGRAIVVSRGIGMERRGAPRLRFLCRPQLVVIDLVPADG